PQTTAPAGVRAAAAAGDVDGNGLPDVLVADDGRAWIHLSCADADHDGVCAEEGDCDDTNPAVKPGATDTPGDGFDGDCDGREQCWYDADDDGYLVASPTLVASDDGDCADPREGRTGDPTTDCDDARADVNPGAAEIVGDGFDQNCNNQEICYDDDDDDGYLDATGDTRTSTDTDCDDAREGLASDPTTDCNDANAAIRPGATEVVGDQVDQNCDGRETCFEDDDDDNYLDTSGDTIVSADLDCADPFEGSNGLPTTDCNDADPLINPTAVEIIGDGVDENCNGQELCFDDDDDDGFLDATGDTRVSTDLDCADAREGTSTDPTTDCNDALATIRPGAPEVVDDGTDQDCDGREACYEDDDDDDYIDTSGDTRLSADLDCLDPFEATRTTPTTDCNDADATIRPGATEVVGDQIDQNCDGRETCFDDDDNDGFLDASGDTRASTDVDCLDANEGTAQDPTTDCNDAIVTIHPGAAEVVDDAIDQDCDGGDMCWDDDDDDGYLDTSGDTRASADLDCADPFEGTRFDRTTDCNDADAQISPRAAERPGDLIDQNCDGAELCFDDDDDDGFLDATSDTRASTDMDCSDPNEGALTDPTTDCDDLDRTVYPGAAEVVGDGRDQSCDGAELCFDDPDDDGFLVAEPATRPSADADCLDPNEGRLADLRTDCDDTRGAVHPGAPEIVGDGIDEDCDGAELCFDDDDDDGFLDAAGDTRVSADLACDAPFEEGPGAPTTDCDDRAPAVYP
ncbi:MAG TPA: MopE-related protein, partial [Myxococcota bacterium]|nr:MopE-related protein [Myxococcota bacterium]